MGKKKENSTEGRKTWKKGRDKGGREGAKEGKTIIAFP